MANEENESAYYTNLLMQVQISWLESCKLPKHVGSHQRYNFYRVIKAHINTTEVSLFDTGVGQEGIDESHIHTDTLKKLCFESRELATSLRL